MSTFQQNPTAGVNQEYPWDHHMAPIPPIVLSRSGVCFCIIDWKSFLDYNDRGAQDEPRRVSFIICLTYNVRRYIRNNMIKSFRCKDTLAIFENRTPKKFRSITAVAERKLQMLDSAKTIADLKSPPGNRLEALRGNRKGSWSIRINDQWRLCFRYEGGDAFDVEIVDYH